eukprot:scaffold11933_cov117-Skeletonema_dohrnii-CCMP3373.AAC.6
MGQPRTVTPATTVSPLYVGIQYRLVCRFFLVAARSPNPPPPQKDTHHGALCLLFNAESNGAIGGGWYPTCHYEIATTLPAVFSVQSSTIIVWASDSCKWGYLELGATSNEASVAWKWTQVVTVLRFRKQCDWY